LTSHKRKAGAELKQELLHFPKDGVFEIPFEVVIVQAEEIKHIGIFQQDVRLHPLFLPQLRQVMPDGLCWLT
jgi:hypothetical protein